MKIKNIIDSASNPQPYDRGTAVMWTDAHISKQLLAMHINPDNDVASRKADSIETTARWILSKLGKNAKVLDLGCGPGLYTQRIAQAGHRVTGVDFSGNAIAYAIDAAATNGVGIDYVCANYLEADIGSGYDLAMMIYCDFGVLSLKDRQTLLRKVHGALKLGGLFVFDALNVKAIERMTFEKSWEMADHGFWKDAPYVCFAEKLHFKEHKAILDQHIVISDNGQSDIYRFWNHYFDVSDVARIAKSTGFGDVSHVQILSGGGSYNDDGVTFYTFVKTGETND